MPAAPWLFAPTTRAVSVLGVTQIVGWGTTYAVPAILVDPISRDLGIPPSLVFAGISVMLLVNAAAAPLLGPKIDRIGAAPVLLVGSIVMAAGLGLLALSVGPITYLCAWAVLGIGMATALATPAFAALVAIGGRGARRHIATLSLFTGLSSTVFWPAMLWLHGMMDWRSILFCFAVLHLVLCLPLHALVLPRRTDPASADPEATGQRPVPAALSAMDERKAFWLVALAFASAGFVGWGLALQLPELFKQLGLAATTAITIAALAGPVQVAARAIDMALSSRTTALGVARTASMLLPASLAGLVVVTLVVPLQVPLLVACLVVFVMSWGAANGLTSVARAAVPLELFDPNRFATAMGRLAIMQNIAFASAPVVLAAALHRYGPTTAVVLSTILALVALGAMIALSRLVDGARSKGSAPDAG
ncbi:MAG: MFS transporter [Hyphomicrobiaceae bacterium]|nr:MFS transporter [Hyphomicrobiaceae bacterium]